MSDKTLCSEYKSRMVTDFLDAEVASDVLLLAAAVADLYSGLVIFVVMEFP